MTRTRIAAVTGAVVVAGALFVGGTTWVSAQTPPTPWTGMHGAMAGSADHAAMMAQHQTDGTHRGMGGRFQGGSN